MVRASFKLIWQICSYWTERMREQSFLKLKLTKVYLLSTISHEKLINLPILSIENDIFLKIGFEIILNNRDPRLQFSNWAGTPIFIGLASLLTIS